MKNKLYVILGYMNLNPIDVVLGYRNAAKRAHKVNPPFAFVKIDEYKANPLVDSEQMRSVDRMAQKAM